MSMRDNSAHFLKALLQKLASEDQNSEHFNAIVIHKYAPAIRDALRLKSEVRTSGHAQLYAHTHALYLIVHPVMFLHMVIGNLKLMS